MKCPGRELLFDPHADADRTAFAAHAATCEECRPLLALHRSTFRALEAQEMIAVDQRGVWAKIDAGRRSARPWFDWQVGLAAAAVLASAIFIFLRVSDPPAATVAVEEWIDIAKTTDLEFSGAALKVGAGSKLLFSADPAAREIRVFRGTVDIAETSLEGAQPLAIETPHARILAVGAKYQLHVAPEKVRIAVERGQITAIDRGVEHRLQENETLELPAAEMPKPAGATQNTENADTPETAPAPRADLEAWMLAADTHRRAGELERAEKLYRRVVAHADGAAYREEASLRRAALLAELGQKDQALRVLQTIAPGGNLRPERAALEARLLLDKNDLAGAARILEKFEDRRDPVLESIREEIERKK